MVKCSNCGRKTKGDFCQWCGYPLMRGRPVRKQNTKKEAELAAKEKAKREAEEAKKAEQAEAKAKKEAELAAKEKAKREAEEAKERAKREAEEAKKAKQALRAELYEGMVKLVVVPPIDLGQMEKLEKDLRQVEDLRLVLVGGSVDEGSQIVVSAGKPIPLIDILREMPPVEQVVKKGNEIQITLKAE